MSWQDKLNSKFEIITPDGKFYYPNWIKASMEVEYNVAHFEFPEISGTLVHRGTPKGRKFHIEIYFQGANCIDDAAKFEKSSRDSRPWVMNHPFYGRVLCQPIGLLFDNSDYNVSKVTGTVVETIGDQFPIGKIDPINSIDFQKTELLNKLSVKGFLKGIPNLKAPGIPQVVNGLRANLAAIYNKGKSMIKLDIDASSYFNAFTTANAALLNLTNDAFNAMTLVTAMIDAPIRFTQSVKNRVTGLTNQFNDLRTSIINLSTSGSPTFTKETKVGYEQNAGCIVSAAAVATVTNMDYLNRQDVINMIESIIALYMQYLADLDNFQSTNSAAPDDYMPDADSIIALSDLVNYTISNLFVVGLNSKQERALYCESDTNVILLAHRLYGLQVDDSTIDTLIANNNISISEMLQVKKGRKIIWYV